MPHDLAATPMRAPQAPLGIDRRAVRQPALPGEIAEQLCGAKRPGGIVVMAHDPALRHVGEIQRAAIRAETGAVGAAHPRQQPLHHSGGRETVQPACRRPRPRLVDATAQEIARRIAAPVVQPGMGQVGLHLGHGIINSGRRIEKPEPLGQPDHIALPPSQPDRPDAVRQGMPDQPLGFRVPPNLARMDVDPDQFARPVIPQHAFAQIVPDIDGKLHRPHLASPSMKMGQGITPPHSVRYPALTAGSPPKPRPATHRHRRRSPPRPVAPARC